jgi:purine-nucleoside phosphorylase
MDSPSEQLVALASAEIRRRWTIRPRAAIVLGTGLGCLSRQVRDAVVVPFREIPGFPLATALGHRGRVVCGHLQDVPVIMLDGRCHLYEGYSFDEITVPIRVMHECGASLLVVSNASGGLNPRFRVGEVMVIDDHISLMGRRVSPGGSVVVAGRPIRREGSPYDAELVEWVLERARRHQFPAHRGVYVAVTGPNYETRAEYRFLRRIGGDTVGMSTVPETLVARRLGMRVLGLSVITNVASPDSPRKVSAVGVVDAAGQAEPQLHRIVADVVAL